MWVPLDCFTRAGCFLHSLFLFICILNCKIGLLLDHRLTTEFQQRLLYVERIYWAFRHSRAKEVERLSYYYGQYFSYPAFSVSEYPQYSFPFLKALKRIRIPPYKQGNMLRFYVFLTNFVSQLEVALWELKKQAIVQHRVLQWFHLVIICGTVRGALYPQA